MPTGPGAEWQLVVIGDSSLWGLGEAYASQIERDLAVKVTLEDFALPSLSAGTVLGGAANRQIAQYASGKTPGGS